MATTSEQSLSILEEMAQRLQKTKINLKKCPKERFTKGYIESRIKSLEDYWNTFKQAHQDLVKSTTREQRGILQYFVNEEFYLQEDVYLELQANLKDMLTLKQKSEKIEDAHRHFSSSVHSPVVQARLPKIQLPVFSGKYEEWPTYQDLFTSLVHQDQTITPVQKLHYLKTTTTGEASSLLKHIQITEENYLLAWNILQNRYGNRKLIVNSLLKRFLLQRKFNIQSAHNLKSLLDITTESLNSLKNMNIDVDSWDPIIIFLVVQKLDSESHRQWEEFAYKENSEELPTWEDLRKFLETKFRTLEMVTPLSNTHEKFKKPQEYSVHLLNNQSNAPQAYRPRKCIKCKDDHTLSHCREFALMKPIEKEEFTSKNNLCYNCLAAGHSARQCKLNMSCRICHRRHHTLLHQPTAPVNKVEEKQSEQSTVNISTHYASNTCTVLLATAIIPVQSESGHTTVLRALIDHGSQATLISEKAAQILRLKRTPISGTITGVGSTQTPVKHASNLYILSMHDKNFNLKVKTYIIPTRLTTQLPRRSMSTTTWPHLEGLVLADPRFYQSGQVDILLGVDVCAQIMKGEVIKGPPGTPCAQNTNLGWILFGNIEHEKHRDEIVSLHTNLDLDEMLKRMWEQQADDKVIPTPEEAKCEQIYRDTTTRTNDGRYIVKLPTKSNKLLSTQGQTRDIALKRLHQLEKRLEKDTKLKDEYLRVMTEYQEMNHIEEVPKMEINKPAVYLPHHAVVKYEKETSKVRTVFNASQKGLNNISLNEELLVGPTLQEDMRSLILRWRMKKVCFVADIQKMYRQILVSKEDKDLQRILWRNDTTEPVKDYRLERVTFGTASAPFLAVRTLHQVADDEGYNYPEAARTIKEDFYMDDLMSGKDTLQEAIQLAKDIDTVLRKGGFVLQKWCSNNAQFLRAFEPCQRSQNVNLDITIDGSIRALGLQWNMGTDKFEYSLNLPALANPITKRNILSDIQRLFDPLGWLAPSILPVKLFIQKLWLQGITWDEEVSETIADEWIKLRESFNYLPELEVDRWLQTTETLVNDISVHGFCDASNRAYAAVAYMRVQTLEGEITTKIIAAKTRVASTKSKSLPRLELCGAVLLSGLLKQIKKAMRIPAGQIYAWTDSTIVLSWLFGDPARWNTYVRNRVVEILEDIGNQNWYHVQSQHNPADVASRGTSIKDLKNNEIWWYGPEWLKEKEIKYNRPQTADTNLERKEIININLKLNEINENFSKKFENCDSITELLKVIAYSKRFLKGKNMKYKDITLTTKEINEALNTCIKIDQKETFNSEIQAIKHNKAITEKSKLKALQPYLDEDGILRVGGRLRHANLNEESRHPIILDKNTYLATLIVADAHLKTCHGGPQLMLSYLRSKFWILKAKTLVKLKYKKCLLCARHNAKIKSQLMGDLPRERVTPTRPFLHSGVDFAGPYQILMSKGRGAKTNKAYIAIFVCMSTKAVHLELVGDLTSDSFIGAMRRFVARRGRCTHLWSDQGRNFVGANKELATAWANAKLQFEGHISETLALDGTQWHFIPAYSPHMGGLWEAAVKSMKYHLKRLLNSNLTYEEMLTLLCQIEACLNSRPLVPKDDSLSDNTEPLTPGHFLVGEAPITIPHPDWKNVNVSYLSRWQYMQNLLNHFWQRWHKDYLTSLQQRHKWRKTVKEFEIGEIVLIKGENLPPAKWMLGRIVNKHPGDDSVTRVYSVKSGQNIVQRSMSKLCHLPIDIN